MNHEVLRIIAFAAIAIFAGTFAQVALTKPYVARLGPFTFDRHSPWQYWSATTLSVVIAVAALVIALGFK